MARLTSSSDREKRKSRSSNRPITQGQNPQRSNRQGVSQATVSNGNSRTRTGTARVTSGQEPPKPVTRQSRVNGRLIAGTDTRPSPNTRASAKPSAKPAGPTPYQVSDPWAKPKRASIGNVKGPASNPNRPAAAPKPPVKPAGNFKAPSVPPAGSATKAPFKGTPQAEQWLKDQLKGKSGNIGKPTLRGVASTGASVALSGLAAAADYKAARDRGETRGRSAAQAGAGLAGGLAGARAGAMLPGGPIVRGAGALLGGSLGYAGALKGMQGIQQASKDAENKGKPTDRDPKPGTYGPPTPKNNLASTIKGRQVGQQAVKDGKPVSWNGYNWIASKSVGSNGVATSTPKSKNTPAKTADNSTNVSRSSGGGGSNRPAPRSSSSGPRLAASKPSAPGQSKDMNENYRTWAAANPTLAAKVKQGQAGYNAFSKDAVAGTGPVRNSKEYKPSVASKPSEVSKPSTTDIAYNKETNLLDKKKKKGQP